jgi:NADPH:quinone reductase
MGITTFVTGMGGCGDYAYTSEANTRVIPSALTSEQAAGFLIGYKTAYYTLVRRADLRAGQTVLVLGATGGTGVAAIQFAKALGARVIAVTSSPAKQAFCQSIGADHSIDHTTGDIGSDVLEYTSGAGANIVCAG